MLEKTERDARITMQLLATIDTLSPLSQRGLSKELGIALGLTNLHIKKCIQQGLVTTVGTDNGRVSYALTPRGHIEKSRLSARYLRSSLSLYEEARRSCRAALEDGRRKGFSGFVLTGRGVLSEIAVLTALEYPELRLAGTLAPDATEDHFLQQPIVKSLDRIGKSDAILFTDMTQPQDSYRTLCTQISATRILVPSVLRGSLIGVKETTA